MGKAPKQKTTASTQAGPSKAQKETASSIDDIFAKPSTAKKADPPQSTKPTASSSSSSASSSKLTETKASSAISSSSTGEVKKKKKKSKIAASFDPSTEAEEETKSARELEEKKKEKSRVVEVVDPSLPAPKPKVEVAAVQQRGKKRDKKDEEEDELFRDSRGDGPRRKTEEGYLIFKEAELGIDPEAGGTPLCPFDCECCF